MLCTTSLKMLILHHGETRRSNPDNLLSKSSSSNLLPSATTTIHSNPTDGNCFVGALTLSRVCESASERARASTLRRRRRRRRQSRHLRDLRATAARAGLFGSWFNRRAREVMGHITHLELTKRISHRKRNCILYIAREIFCCFAGNGHGQTLESRNYSLIIWILAFYRYQLSPLV